MNAILTVSTDGAVGDSKFRAEIREAQKVLTQLGEPYQNYKIDAKVTPDEKIVRYFTISPGISTLNVAHIIAREAGLLS
jgi:hypothetical protein